MPNLCTVLIRDEKFHEILKINIGVINGLLEAGASIPPETMMHFPPVSDFPPISEKFSDFLKFFLQFYLFPKNFFTFISQNF